LSVHVFQVYVCFLFSDYEGVTEECFQDISSDVVNAKEQEANQNLNKVRFFIYLELIL